MLQVAADTAGRQQGGRSHGIGTQVSGRGYLPFQSLMCFAIQRQSLTVFVDTQPDDSPYLAEAHSITTSLCSRPIRFHSTIGGTACHKLLNLASRRIMHYYRRNVRK